MKLAHAAGVLLAIAFAVIGPRPATAQYTLGGMNVEGSVEAGLRGFLTDEPKNKERAKFEEYRDMGAGPFLERLQLRFFTKDEGYSSTLSGSKWGRQDQEFSLSTGRLGLWELQLDWDQIPHLLSTTARTSMHEGARGIWTLPGIRGLSDFNGQATSHSLGDLGV